MTALPLHLSHTATHTSTDHDVKPPDSLVRRTWACNSCNLSFETSEAQRVHMKSSWHVYNLKRRIAALPPITLQAFEEKIQPDAVPVAKESKRNANEKEEEGIKSPYQCLFCHLKFEDDTAEFDNVLEHMSTAHGMFIPNKAKLTDVACFLGYLATAIGVWHECIYCGITRTSTQAIQSHMRDSGHSMFDLEREPELLEFWDQTSNAGHATMGDSSDLATGSEQRLRLLSVETTSSGRIPRRKTKTSRASKTSVVLRAGTNSTVLPRQFMHQSTRQLARRDEMGLQNISPHQRHALLVAVKRSQQAQAVATRAKEWTYGRKANDQKHDQNYGPLSWAKGGLHSLLPR